MNTFTVVVLVSLPLGVLAYRAVHDIDLKPLRLPLSILGLLMVLALVRYPLGYDLYAFYTVNPADPYLPAEPGLQGQGAFRYTPPLAMLMAPLALFPWPVVVTGWLGLQLLALWYVGRGWALALVVFPPVWADMAWGNIGIFIAAMIIAGFRNPEVWTFAILTKVTPGVGALWFLYRQEWHALLRLGIVLGSALIVSIAVQGLGVWEAWLNMIRTSVEDAGYGAMPIPLLPRVAAAAALLLWGAMRPARWTVVVATTLAMPVLWPIAFAPLIAWVGLALRSEAGMSDASIGRATAQ